MMIPGRAYSFWSLLFRWQGIWSGAEFTIHTEVRDLAGHPVEPPRNNEVLEQQVKSLERALERSHDRLEVLMEWNIANSIQATNPSSPSN